MQQVNLYLKELRPKFDPFAARTALFAMCIFVVVMGVWAMLANARLNQKQQEVNSISADVKNEESKLGRLKILGKPSDKSQIEESVNQMRTAIDNRIYIKGLIGNNAFGNDQGFSVLMTALSQAALKDLYLNDFGLSAGGHDLYLHGKTTRVDAVPEYIKALQQNSAMASVNIGALKLTRMVGGQMEFRLGEWNEKIMGNVSDPLNLDAPISGQNR